MVVKEEEWRESTFHEGEEGKLANPGSMENGHT